MRGTEAVQVVLGEGEPGLLRLILEAEGFHVVGQARGDAELRRVLDATHPSVVVLDAGISAPAAQDARTRAIGARFVVVWPEAVRSSLADERVDPATVLQDLGGAVRRAAERARPIVDDVVTIPDSAVLTIPDSAVVAVDTTPGPAPLRLIAGGAAAEPRRTRRTARRLLVIAAAWALALVASAAIAYTVPKTIHWLEGRRPAHAPSTPSFGGTDRTDPSVTIDENADRGPRGPKSTPAGEPRGNEGASGSGLGNTPDQGQGGADEGAGAGDQGQDGGSGGNDQGQDGGNDQGQDGGSGGNDHGQDGGTDQGQDGDTDPGQDGGNGGNQGQDAGNDGNQGRDGQSGGNQGQDGD